jgi:PAS domain S-box-containing protein
MKPTPSYEELIKKVQLLEKEANKRRRIEAQLKVSEKRFRDIAENALEWIWEIDSTGRYTYSSPVVKSVLGYEPNEVVGKFFYDFFHPDEKDQLRKNAFKTFSKNKPFRKFINRNVCKNGRPVVLLTSGVPLFDSKGSLIGYRGADTDITDQYNAEESLRKSQEHLQPLMESATGFTIYRLVYDPTLPHSLRVVFISPSFEDILGIPEPMKFETWFDSVHPDDIDRLNLANQHAFETQRFDQVYRTYHPEKEEWRWIHAIATGGTRADGWNRYVNGIMIDITEKQQTVEHLKAHERELESKTKELEQMNAALNVLLNKRDRDKLELEQSIILNIKEMVTPYFKKLQKSGLSDDQQALMGLIDSNLKEITSKLTMKLSIPQLGLSPAEIKVANYVKQGKNSKEIGLLLGLSFKTIKNQRNSIRKKLGISGRKINLRSYLLALDEES